jgi:hypothetical protein
VGVTLGPAEKKALQARNIPAHGGIRKGADHRKLVRHANAYRVLFVRAFLALLGDRDAEYVDRTTLGHPARPIATPAGGSD